MKINNSYSIALYEVYKEEKNKKKFYDDIQSIYLTVTKNSDIVRILSSKMLSKKERKKIIDNIFNKKINNYIKNFLCILVDDEYVKNIKQIFKLVLKEIDHNEDQIFVKIESAFKMNDRNLKEILNTIKEKWNKKMDYTLIINPYLIGGIKIYIDDNEIDGSIEGKIKSLKKEINIKDKLE